MRSSPMMATLLLLVLVLGVWAPVAHAGKKADPERYFARLESLGLSTTYIRKLAQKVEIFYRKPTSKKEAEYGYILRNLYIPWECKEETSMPSQALHEVGFREDEATSVKIYKGRGCSNCNNTGYRGRVGLFEVMEVSEEVRELILSGASAMELKRKSMEEGMIDLRRSGLEKIKQGMTTVEEVVRETVL